MMIWRIVLFIRFHREKSRNMRARDNPTTAYYNINARSRETDKGEEKKNRKIRKKYLGVQHTRARNDETNGSTDR